MRRKLKHRPSAYVVAVDMGYGHERAAHALEFLASDGRYLVANNYEGIPQREFLLWNQGRKLYETISRIKRLPLIGDAIFDLLIDREQTIPPFYPKRDLSAPSGQIHETYFLIEKLGLGKHLIEELAKKPLPLVCTFFAVAFAAEIYHYPEEIYLTVCDADMSRAWVAREPKKSRIKYFAPTGRVVERLKLYGVPAKNIFHTGFPLPPSTIGGATSTIINPDLHRRLCQLDPSGIFFAKYARTLERYFGPRLCAFQKQTQPTVLTFAVGGAGTQQEIGALAAAALVARLKQHKIELHLVAGARPEVARFYHTALVECGLKRELGRSVFILETESRHAYFDAFNALLRKTDVLWTKPSELSFFTGIGLPIIMAPAVGSQEVFNRRWLHQVGGGVGQNDPRYVNEWLFDWIESGGLARLAWNGFIEAPTHGAYRIADILKGSDSGLERLPFII